jgi:hypothetical protein
MDELIDLVLTFICIKIGCFESGLRHSAGGVVNVGGATKASFKAPLASCLLFEMASG